MNRKLYFGAGLAATTILLLWFVFNGLSSTTQHQGTSAKSNLGTSMVNRQGSGSVLGNAADPAKSGSLTYQPGVKRIVSQYPGPVEVGKRGSGWWLLARSPSEADWLDMHGYPTLAEERLLAEMSEADLKARADAGDLNARTHLAVRTAKSVFLNGNKIQIEAAANGLGFALNSGGPYAATKTVELVADLLTTYYALPNKERTDAVRNALREFSVYREIAAALSIAHGDHTIDLMYTQTSATPDLKLATGRDVDSRTIAYSIANASMERASAGRGPLTFVPRPLPPEVPRGDPGKYREFSVVFERR